MSELTPAQIVLTLACAIAALAVAYLLIMRLARQVIDDLGGEVRTRYKLPYQARCCTVPEPHGFGLVALSFCVFFVVGALAAGAIAFSVVGANCLAGHV